MRAHYLQHVPFEGLGHIEVWLQQAGYEISKTPFFESEELPEIDDFDLLIVMGGPMSVNDKNQYPWLATEIKFIQRAAEAGKRILGICLGAQLMASAMGAEIFPNSEKEIGWFPIQPVKTHNHSIFQFPKEIDVFHWHGETFSLPPGAIQLAQSKACTNQAFQIGQTMIGLQFHLETTLSSAQKMVDHCKAELVEGLYIQSESQILSISQEHYTVIHQFMENILEYLHTRKV